MPEFAGSKLALAVLGAQSAVLASTDAGGTPLTTTLAAAAAIGDTSVKVVAITNDAAGGWIRINVAGALAEYRRIDVVGTAGRAAPASGSATRCSSRTRTASRSSRRSATARPRSLPRPGGSSVPARRARA